MVFPDAPAAPRLPRVDIHVMTQRNALRGDGYTEFRQFFKYDALPDPEAQLALADIYDNPVLTAVTPDGEFDNTDLTPAAGRKIAKAPPDQQPSFVVHPLYWEGKLGEHPTEAIKQPMTVLVTVLTIDHSSIVLNDVVAILSFSHTLQSLEVRNVVADGRSAMIFMQSEEQNEAKSLSALTLTSCVPLDPVFNTVKFPALESISLMLRGSASSTGFDGLIKQFQGRHAPPLKMFTLRGGLQQESLDQLVDLLEARTIPFRQYLT
ncbi:hypothetical protein NMY22_g8409 [Coprinellus aureogranulatus]|nr:hypothetical protein NMY22_g8409 [Coprinellus aureogranulatus]